MRLRRAGEDGRHVRKKLTNNIGLKVLSLLMAFGIWIVVVNIDDPVISNTYSGIVVEVINGDSLAKQGKIYEVKDQSNVITVTVTGKRSVVESLGKENIRAVADMQNLTLMDTAEIRLSTNKNFENIDSMKSSIHAVKFNIENLKVVHLPINITAQGVPQDNYVIGDMETDQNTVTVSGPESVINEIASANVEVSVGGRSSDVTTTADIVFKDKSGKVVESNYITGNIDEINLKVAILPTKTVDVVYSYQGAPMDGYLVDGKPVSNHDTVTIAGKQSVIDYIYAINIPESVIDIDGSNEDVVTAVDITRYLPEGTRFADSNFTGKAEVTVAIKKAQDKTLLVPMKNIGITNVPQGYSAEILMNSEAAYHDENSTDVLVKVETRGIADSYAGVTGNTLAGTVDVGEYMQAYGITQLTEGTYHMTINFSLPEGVTVNEPCYADVVISSTEAGD